MTTPTAHPQAVNGDRWEAVKEQACPAGKRSIDVNHARQEVRWFCDRCRKTHTYRVGQSP